MWRPESVYDASGHLDEGVIHAWLDDALEAGSAREAEMHAQACAACASRVAEARGLIAGAGRVLGALDEPVDVPRPAIGASASTSGSPTPIAARRPRNVLRRYGFAAAAVFVFAAGAVVLREYERGGGAERAVFVESAEPVAESAASTAPAIASAPTTGAAGDASSDAAGSGAASAAVANRATADVAPPPPRPAPAPRLSMPTAPPDVRAREAAPLAGRVGGVVTTADAAAGVTGSAAPTAPQSAARMERRVESPRARAVSEPVTTTGLPAGKVAAPSQPSAQQRSAPQPPSGGVPRRSAALLAGCWRLAGTDTLLSGDSARVVRLVGPEAVALRVQASGDSLVRVSGWASGVDLVVRGAGDTLRATAASRSVAELVGGGARLVRQDSASCNVRPW